MKKNRHSAVWFEIPVTDLARATAFYSTVLGVEMQTFEAGPTSMSLFPVEPGGDPDEHVVHGALVQGPGYEPGGAGALLYLNGGDDLAAPLSRVEPAGGTIVQPKTAIGEHGFMAWFLDTEGNRLALHSPA